MVDIKSMMINTVLDQAQAYADANSTCSKVKVGSCILVESDGLLNIDAIYGCNHGINNCVVNGCRRVHLYGEDSKLHRLPSDCDAIHSEIDAISKAAREGYVLNGSTIFVTRYPCEACARAIAASGIKKVFYGRKESISEYTHQILQSAGVEVTKVYWEREDNNE